MAIDTNIIISTNLFAGFQNYTSSTFSVAYSGGNITAGSFAGPVRATTPLNNSNAVSIIEVQFSGLESFTRFIPGSIAIDYPNTTSPSYQIEVLVYYTGGNLVADAYIVNQTGATVTIPAITFNYTAKLYQPPF